MNLITYTHEDAEDVRRKLDALLATGCRSHTGVYNDGLTLGVVVANRAKKSKLYEFGWAAKSDDELGRAAPPVTDLALLQIVAEWKTGEPAATPADPLPLASAAQPEARQIDTRETFIDWLREAKPGAQALYHRGSIAHYRKDAPARLVELQRLADAAKPAHPRPVSESVEMQQIQDRLELIATVTQMEQAGLVRLIQRRQVEGGEGNFIYLAIKKGR